MIRAVIFDCFGVVIGDALEVLCNDLRARDPAAAEQVRVLVQASNRGITDPRQSSHEVAALLGLSYEEYRSRIAAGEVKDTQLLAYITQLRSRYKTALLSNIGAGSLARRFSAAELAEHFDVVVASGEIGHAKPDPQAYLVTARRLGVQPEECVFTDDREPYCRGACAAGMQAIYYQGFAQFRTELERLLADTQ